MNVESRMRILVVDDEGPARHRLRDLLADCAQKLQLEVVGEAANGREALELVSVLNPNVVLLDIRMPEVDGIEVARHLQKLEAAPAVVFTTAYDAYAIKAFEVNAVDYLLKPIRAARLEAALRRARSTVPPERARISALRSAGAST
jgi:two-component system response regulator AlgR